MVSVGFKRFKPIFLYFFFFQKASGFEEKAITRRTLENQNRDMSIFIKRSSANKNIQAAGMEYYFSRSWESGHEASVGVVFH